MNKSFVPAIALTILMLASCSKIKLTPGIPLCDGFENPSLGNLWETDKIIAADMKMQTAIVRSGHSALEISLHTSDELEAGRHGNPDSERAELTEADGLVSQEGKKYAYEFSMLIPANFPIVSRRLIIAQWKQECPRGRACDDNGPVLAVRYISGVLSVTQTTGSHRTILWQSHEDVRNKWLNFNVRVCFSANADGWIVARLNDSLIVDFKGVTAYQEDQVTGYTNPGRFYFKMGLYRDTMTEPMTIYIDDYSKELLTNE